MNRWKFMFHKIMLHSVPPSNFRDNSSTLVISSPFKLAPFFLRIWYKIVLCERICKMINVWIYLVELWLRNVVTFLWISVSTEKATYQCYLLNLMNFCKIFEKNCPISTFCNFSYEILHFSKTQSWQHWYATNCWKTQFYKNFLTSQHNEPINAYRWVTNPSKKQFAFKNSSKIHQNRIWLTDQKLYEHDEWWN